VIRRRAGGNNLARNRTGRLRRGAQPAAVTRREYFDTLAAALGTPPPKFPPQWTMRLLGSAGELLSRSQRISNRKLRSQSQWAPKSPSVREGWRAVVPAMEKNGQTAAA
jgi:nucleoside-diphosphate-sugar epimerase